jgi:hypothetical protein
LDGCALSGLPLSSGRVIRLMVRCADLTGLILKYVQYMYLTYCLSYMYVNSFLDYSSLSTHITRTKRPWPFTVSTHAPFLPVGSLRSALVLEIVVGLLEPRFVPSQCNIDPPFEFRVLGLVCELASLSVFKLSTAIVSLDLCTLVHDLKPARQWGNMESNTEHRIDSLVSWGA